MESISRGLAYVTTAAVNAPGSSRVTTVQATIRVPAASASHSGGAELRAVLRLAYQPPATRLDFPGANLDQLNIQIGLQDVGNGLVAIRRMSHCDNASCSLDSTSGITFFDTVGFNGTAAAAYDTAYTVMVTLNEGSGVFSWSISGGALGTLSGTVNPGAYLTGNANWAAIGGVNALAGTGFQNAQLRTRALDTAGGSSASISGQFDDVLVGFNNAAATPWDDFSGTGSSSGPLELRADKWTAGEHSRALAGGSLAQRSRITSRSTSGLGFGQALAFSNPGANNTIQADVTLNACANSLSGSNRVQLVGTLYNDGTPGDGPSPNTNQANSSVGDVQAFLNLDCLLGAHLQIIRWTSQSPQQGALLTNTFVPVPMGNAAVIGGMHTLRMSWDPVTRRVTFQVDSATPVVVDPTMPGAHVATHAPFVKAANSPFWAIQDVLSIPASGTSVGATASMDYKVNNVFTAP
jgi:hypothetical protein